MKVCSLTRISSPAPEICPDVLLTRDVFYAEKVLLYHHGPTENTLILIGQHPSGILGVYDQSGV